MDPNQVAWVWQDPDWPQLTFDAATITPILNAARFAQGKLVGMGAAIGLDEAGRTGGEVWVGDALATAAIEGERLNADAVRSSVARRMGISAPHVNATRAVEGLLDVMTDAAGNWDTPLTNARICKWQAALFPDDGARLVSIKTGAYRTHAEPMQIVSGPIGRETIHYQAPPSANVAVEMAHFLAWFNKTRPTSAGAPLDGLVRAGLAHLWFEIIHPFEDGNGRVGRAVIDLALAQDFQRDTRIWGVSAALLRQQTNYYAALNAASRSGANVTVWLVWFLQVFRDACEHSAGLIAVTVARAQFWATHRAVAINGRQRKALEKLLDAGPGQFAGGMTPRKYQSLVGTTGVTATRDLASLAESGLLTRRGAGRSTYYEINISGWEWVIEK